VKIRELLPRLDRLQHSMPFKIAASLVCLALAAAAFTVYFVSVTAPGAAFAAELAAAEEAARAAGQTFGALDAGTQMLVDLADRRANPTNVGVGLTLIAAVAITVVWLGLGLSYLALLAIALGVALPLAALGFPAMSRVLAGIVVLTAAFVALLQAMRLVFSGPGPVMGIARNVLIEAVRMRVAMVFIVLLIFGMAALPGLLDSTTPLRYRVQSFLQYGTGGSYWIIAVLILFFAVGTVAFEQRDRQIWQTMTKPVAAWQYILGKWLGVVSLAAVLLAVSCAGIFLFTEYLRKQPAMGESVQMLVGQSMATNDRLILESQVLTANKVAEPTPPVGPNDEYFLEGVRAYIIDMQARDPNFAHDREGFEKVKADLYKSLMQSYRSIGPGQYRDFIIEGLGEAKRRNSMVTLRYRIDSAGNPPGVLYNLTFNFGGVTHPPQNVSLGPSHTLSLYPSVISEDGTITMTVFNGALLPVDDPPGAMTVIPNPETMSFPPGGLQVSYSAGSFQMNFVRVALVLWLKLAFLAILGITAATFLSFPVACLVAFSVFIAAEGAGFLANSIQYYDALDHDGNVVYWKIPVRAMGLTISTAFKTYAELRPTMRLVDGRLLSWGSVMWGLSIILIWSAVLYVFAVGIFRRRELATYSGQ
jgi:hypothetical protein